MISRILVALGALAAVSLALIIGVPAVAQGSPCSGTAAIPSSASADLAKDCDALLAAKDTLRGTADLNWGYSSAITSWEGITVGGTPQRVTRLDLPRRGLNGSIPAELGKLSALEHLNLARNQLTGAIPSELGNLGEQGPIVHLQADLRQAVAWADANRRRWAFTLSNAASAYAEERRDLAALGEIDWDAVEAEHWMLRKEEKQAEFLVEHSFPWELVSFIGVHSLEIRDRVRAMMRGAGHQPVVAAAPNWYY